MTATFSRWRRSRVVSIVIVFVVVIGGNVECANNTTASSNIAPETMWTTEATTITKNAHVRNVTIASLDQSKNTPTVATTIKSEAPNTVSATMPGTIIQSTVSPKLISAMKPSSTTTPPEVKTSPEVKTVSLTTATTSKPLLESSASTSKTTILSGENATTTASTTVPTTATDADGTTATGLATTIKPKFSRRPPDSARSVDFNRSFDNKAFLQNMTIRLEGVCTVGKDELSKSLEEAFKKIAPNTSEVVVRDEVTCKKQLQLNVTLSVNNNDLKLLITKLEEHIKNISVGDSYTLTHFSLDDGTVVYGDRPIITRSRFPTYREEIIIFVAVGILLAIVLVISCVVCFMKCCRQTPSKPMDFLAQTPTLRMEDYSLTRIPRAQSMLYEPSARSPLSDYSSCVSPTGYPGPVVQPFDTCVVPLEDAPTSPNHRSSPRPSPQMVNPAFMSNGRPQRPHDLAIRRPRSEYVVCGPDEPHGDRFRGYPPPAPGNTRTLPSTFNRLSYPANLGTRNVHPNSMSRERLTKTPSDEKNEGLDNEAYAGTPTETKRL